ncbi:MAG: hypothetical protein H6835_19735 [Planctomycetes bacterium]|nr:hypothetical protein [Planctomycetota bacterium]
MAAAAAAESDVVNKVAYLGLGGGLDVLNATLLYLLAAPTDAVPRVVDANVSRMLGSARACFLAV